MNPILDAMMNTATNNSQFNSVKGMINFVQAAQNKESAVMQLAGMNPNVRQALEFVKQSGGDPKKAFYNLAQQRGVNPESILNSIR